MAGNIIGFLMFIVLPISICVAIYLLSRAFVRCPKHLRAHFLTALAWTLITGIATVSLIIQPDKNIIAYIALLVSGLAVGPSWRKLAERKQELVTVMRRRNLLQHLLLQTLWGPVALFLVINGVQSFKQAFFEDAIQHHNLTIALLLCDCGMGDVGSLDATIDGEESIWDRAIDQQDAATVADCLAIRNFSSYAKGNALTSAVGKENTMITELLLDAGTDPNGGDDRVNYPPIHMATRSGKINQVRTLLRYGADPDAKNDSGETALHVARERGYKDIAALLLQASKQQPH